MQCFKYQLLLKLTKEEGLVESVFIFIIYYNSIQILVPPVVVNISSKNSTYIRQRLILNFGV